MPEVIRWVVSHLPTEAVMILSSPTGVSICSSPMAGKFMEIFGSENISDAARNCGEELVREFKVLVPEKKLEYLEMDTVEIRFKSKVIPQLPMASIVTMERLPVYDDLMAEFELVSYTAETLPKGIGLNLFDPTSEHNGDYFAYVTETFARLVGCTTEMLKGQGMSCIRVNAEDVPKLYPGLFNTVKQLEDASVVVRVFTEGEYKWRRFLTRSIPGDNGLFMTCITVEDFTEDAQDLEFASKESSTDQSASFMLRSFVSALFDASFYVDSNFRIVDDSPKLRYFFSSDESVKGQPIEVFIKLDEDQVRFHEYMTRPLEVLASADPELDTLPAAPMIRLRLALAGGLLTDVQLYASPTYLNAFEGFDSSLGSDESGGSMYLVGIRVQPNNPTSTCSERIADSYATSETGVPTDLEESDISFAASVSAKGAVKGPQLLSRVPEDIDCSDTDSECPSVASSERPETRRSAPRRSMITHSLQRFIGRDMVHALTSMEAKIVLRRMREEVSQRPHLDWLIPLYDISDFVVMEEELVRTLSNTLQGNFIRASRQGMYMSCSQLLAYTLDGNANILPNTPKKDLIENSDLLHCAYRFFIGLLPRLSPEHSYKLLVSLSESVKRISGKLGKSGTEVATLEFTLALITGAIRHPDWFSSRPSIQWLRKTFADALQISGTKHVDKSRRLPTVYYMCILWGCLMKVFQREDEAKSLLENIYDDMEQYCTRHPESTAVRQLQTIAAHNLAVMDLANDRVYPALTWIFKVQAILRTTHVIFSRSCTGIVEWAERMQAHAQSQAPSQASLVLTQAGASVFP